jgi:hypothetical protein
MMTISVYRLDRQGRKTDLASYEVPYDHDPERLQDPGIAYPPCRCPRHRAEAAR